VLAALSQQVSGTTDWKNTFQYSKNRTDRGSAQHSLTFNGISYTGGGIDIAAHNLLKHAKIEDINRLKTPFFRKVGIFYAKMILNLRSLEIGVFSNYFG